MTAKAQQRRPTTEEANSESPAKSGDESQGTTANAPEPSKSSSPNEDEGDKAGAGAEDKAAPAPADEKKKPEPSESARQTPGDTTDAKPSASFSLWRWLVTDLDGAE